MATINKTNTLKNAVEIKKVFDENGVAVEHIVVDGQNIGILGYVDEEDKQRAINAIQTAFDASNGDVYAMMKKLCTIATIKEKEISPDEAISVNGAEYIVSYEAKTAYDTYGEIVATCNELPDMPNEAIKAILVERIKNREIEDYEEYM